MKKFLLLTILLFAVYSLFGVLEYQRSGDGLRVTFVNDENSLEQSELEQIIALPSKGVDIIINDCVVEEYSGNGELLRTRSDVGEDHVKVQKSFIMRNLYAHQFSINKTKKILEIIIIFFISFIIILQIYVIFIKIKIIILNISVFIRLKNNLLKQEKLNF